MATRWGICGAGLISSDFVTVLKALPPSEHQVVAVAAKSSKSKAEAFAEKFDIPAAYGSYVDLAEDKNVEIVYVGTIHMFHHEVCLLFLNNGKHVLCEKPMALSLKECEEIIMKAKEKNLFFMEGIWTRFFPAYKDMLNEVNTGYYGDIKCIRSTFAANANDVLKPHGKEITSGAILASGVYPVTYIQQFFKEKPEKITAVGQFSKQGGDIGVCLILQYKGGKLGIAYVHADVAPGNSTVVLHGTEGTLEVMDDMHTPHTIKSSLTGQTHHFPMPDIKGPFNWWNSNCLKYEAESVRWCLLQGLKECPHMTHEDSLIMMYILDEACKQLGVKNEFPW